LQAKDRIILALDVNTEQQALNLVDQLTEYVGVFKVGMQLFNSVGPEIVKKINSRGGRVFVDLKFHDIPNTVAAASRVMARLNCFMFNVHAAGGKEMMTQAVAAVEEEAKLMGIPTPLILAVTVLTSISQQQLEEEMLVRGVMIEDVVRKWSLMAHKSGISGVVCSPQEIVATRKACGTDFKIITPGIRPLWSAKNDQKRVTTPKQAVEMGADYIVIGRPITGAKYPQQAAKQIIEELEG